MATNHEKKKSEEPDFSTDSTLEFHNKQNLKDLNSEAYSSNHTQSKNEGSDDIEYKNRSVSKSSVRDRIPKTDTGISPEQ